MIVRCLPALLLLTACNPSRDDQDEATLNTLSLMLVERQDLRDNLEKRQAEQVAVRERLAALAPVTTADLLSLAGEGAKVTRDSAEGFYSLVTIARPGTPKDVLSFVRAALARSRAVNVTEVRFGDAAFEVTFGVIRPPPPRPAKTSTSAPAPSVDTSWCYASCRARRERIVETGLRIGAIEKVLGKLIDLPREKKELHDLLSIDEKFIGDEAEAAFATLEAADWISPGTSITFSPRMLMMKAPADVAAQCAASFPACRYEPSKKLFEIPLSAP